jgi:hypothetical protein
MFCACGSVETAPDARTPDGASIDAAAPPTLTSVVPPSGVVTTQITLTGSDFGAARGAGTIDVGGAEGTVISWSDTQIVATVPASLFPGDADVTVTTAGGVTGPQPFTVTLPPMAYVNNDSNDTTTGFDSVTAMSFDPSTGALAQLGSPISIGVPTPSYGGCSSSALIHEHTRRLFVTGTGAVAVFDIDPVTGALTPVTGSPFQTGTNQYYGIAINAAGTRLFVADYTGFISVFDVSSTGVLTPLTGSPFPSGGPSDTPVLTSNASFIYTNNENNTFSALGVAGTGELTPLASSPFATGGTNSFAAGRRPGHDQLYIPDATTGIAAWNLDPVNGTPTPVPGSPFAFTATAGQLHFPAFTADGNRVYISSYSTGSVYGFDLDASGSPTQIAGSPWDLANTLASSSCMAVSQDGRFLLVADEGNARVGVQTLAGDGTPTPVTGSPFAVTAPSDISGLAITF